MDNKTLKKILSLIQNHVGKENPIQADELVKKVGLPDREIRRAVQTLINDWDYAIGSTTKGPYGFFIISNEEDFVEAIGNLLGRDNELVKRIKKLYENTRSQGVKIKNFKKKIVDGNTTINIKNLIFINFSNE